MKSYVVVKPGRKIMVAALLVLLLAAGCAGPSSLMVPAPEGEVIPAPATDKAMLVFLRPSGVGFAVQSKVIDVTSEEEPRLVGFVGARTKVAYETDPGESIFMVTGGENTPFLEAELAAGKTYYAKVSPMMGFLYARFAVRPVREEELAGDEFSKWFSDCSLYSNSDQSYQWFTDNLEDIKEKRAKKLPQWMEKTQEERDNLTIHQEDGR